MNESASIEVEACAFELYPAAAAVAAACCASCQSMTSASIHRKRRVGEGRLYPSSSFLQPFPRSLDLDQRELKVFGRSTLSLESQPRFEQVFGIIESSSRASLYVNFVSVLIPSRSSISFTFSVSESLREARGRDDARFEISSSVPQGVTPRFDFGQLFPNLSSFFNHLESFVL